MVKIIKGTYGYVGENGIPTPKTCNDEPFSVNPEEEQRLIELGVAVHVDDEAEAPKKAKEEPKAEPKKQASEKSTKKKAKNKKDTADEEPPAFEAADPV